MDNHDPYPDSLEQLDALRASGKVSAEEYEALREALERSEPPRPAPLLQHARLRKSWRQRQIGGVCGGIATFLDVNPWLVRILAILLALSSCGLALLVYLVLYIALPWDEEDADLVWRFSWGYALGILALCVAIIFGMRWLSVQATPVFADAGGELPAMTRWVLGMSGYWPLLIIMAVFLALLDGMFPRQSTRKRVFRLITLCGLSAFAIMCVLAFWLPLKDLGAL